MFTRYRTQGFIIKKTNQAEADQLLIVYTKDFGKLEILGRGIRKIKSKLRSGAEVFCLSEIEFIQGKTYKTLTAAILIDNFKNLKKDLKKLKIGYQVLESLNDLVKEQEPDEKIWRLLGGVLQKLDGLTEVARPFGKNTRTFLATDYWPLFYYYFFWNLVSLLGYQPELYHCFLCGKKLMPENIFFNLKEKGIACNQCSKKINSRDLFPLSLEIIKIIRIFLKKDLPLLKRLKIRDSDIIFLKKISHYY
jgi:DNA repair protein RecO (recombination protein O)